MYKPYFLKNSWNQVVKMYPANQQIGGLRDYKASFGKIYHIESFYNVTYIKSRSKYFCKNYN